MTTPNPSSVPTASTNAGGGTVAIGSAAEARCPACVWVEAASVSLPVAALPVLDRLLVALHRAGCGPITVVASGPLPRLPRSTAWRVPFVVVPEAPVRTTATVVLRSDTLVEVVDFRRLLAEPRPVRLTGRDGVALPVGRLPAGDAPVDEGLAALPGLTAQGVTCRVRDAAEARQATSALWASITSGSDGFVDRVFNRPVGRPLSRLLVHTPVTPNQISVAATLIGVLAAGMFAIGRSGWMIAAALLFQLSAIIDCVDGDVARAVFKESRLGKWLDIVGDQVVHVAVFGGIALGLVNGGSVGKVIAWLGLSAMVGAVVSFLVVLRGWREARRWGGDGGRMQQILDAATNRDFSVLVLILAIVGKLSWFIWLAGVGSHVFWMVLLGLQVRMRFRAEGRR